MMDHKLILDSEQARMTMPSARKQFEADPFDFVGCLLLLMTSACSSMTPDEIFERNMARELGHNFVAVPQQLTHIGKLPNGNDEYRYHFWKTCYVIYEVSPTNIVVSWKYAGDSTDCYINP